MVDSYISRRFPRFHLKNRRTFPLFTSNVLLEVSCGYASHPLRALCDAGVRCTVNSDDPLPFGTDITGEYHVLLREMGFSLREVGAFAKNAFAASLLDPVKRAALCTEVDRALQ
jgi:adenosine deaminase